MGATEVRSTKPQAWPRCQGSLSPDAHVTCRLSPDTQRSLGPLSAGGPSPVPERTPATAFLCPFKGKIQFLLLQDRLRLGLLQ